MAQLFHGHAPPSIHGPGATWRDVETEKNEFEENDEQHHLKPIRNT